MTDHYLRFPDATTMLDALRPLGMTHTADDAERVSTGSHQYALHEVGEIPGYTGWHANLRVIDDGFDVSSLEQWRVTPGSPKCVWA